VKKKNVMDAEERRELRGKQKKGGGWYVNKKPELGRDGEFFFLNKVPTEKMGEKRGDNGRKLGGEKALNRGYS